jgi:hypothetical protein
MAKIKGGDGLKKALKELSGKVGKGAKLQVGFLEGSTYPDEKHTSVPMVAAIQNYGAPAVGILARPFFSNMVKAKSPQWGQQLANILVTVDYDSDVALDRMGEGIEGQLRQAIIDTNSPPLSPITVMLRGMKSQDQSLVVTGKTVGEAARRVRLGLTNWGASTKVLDETGYMLGSVAHDVKAKY